MTPLFLFAMVVTSGVAVRENRQRGMENAGQELASEESATIAFENSLVRMGLEGSLSKCSKYDVTKNSPDKEFNGVVPGQMSLFDKTLGIAYGPAFGGKGQIMAWKYDSNAGTVISYFAKESCMDPVGDGGCSDGEGNLPGRGSCALCPSCSGGMFSGCSIDANKKFAVGGTPVSLAGYAEGVIREVNGVHRIEVSSGCYFHHVWVYSTFSKCAEAVCSDAQGNVCSCGD